MIASGNANISAGAGLGMDMIVTGSIARISIPFGLR
jgi:hypothetical protein